MPKDWKIALKCSTNELKDKTNMLKEVLKVLKCVINALFELINALCNCSPGIVGVFKFTKRGHICIRENSICIEMTHNNFI